MKTAPARTTPVTGSASEKLDPVERYVPLLVKGGVYALLTVFFFQAFDAFAEYRPGMRWGNLLFIVRTFTFLPLHEGGHFLFILFGRTLYVLGGSFWQIVFPLLWFLIALRQRSQVFPFPLFWVGENMMDVSLYIRDAPARMLPLLGGDKSGHDWHYLLSRWDAMDAAGTLADIMYYGGALISLGALAIGFGWAVIVFVKSGQGVPVTPARGPVMSPEAEESVEEEIRKMEGLK